MKKTKLLTTLAAFVLVLGLGACDEVTQENTPDEGSETTETTESGDTTEGTTPSEPTAYAIVGDFTDNSWNASPATDSDYYIPAGTEEYKVTVTIDSEPVGTEDWTTYGPWAAGFRVVNYGTWDLAVGYSHLDGDSTGAWQGSSDNNIAVNWGATYDLVITFGDTPSILVTQVGPTLLGVEVDGVINYIDGGLVGSYSYEGSLTTNIDEAIPVTCTEVDDGGYYLTFELNATTYYVCIIEIDDGYTDLQYETTPTAIYYDATLDGWVNADDTYFLCYNSAYKCFYASALSDYGPNSSNPSPIAHLYDYPTITGIALSADSTQVEETQSLRIDVTYTPSTIGASDLTWVSSDEDVATVEDGRVTGVEASDTPVTITATAKNGLTATIDITVIAYEVPEGLICSYDFSLASDVTNSKMDATRTLTLFNESFVAGESSSTIVTSIEGAPTNAYPVAGGTEGTNTNLQLSKGCLKLGGSSSGGSVTLNLSQEVSKVVVKATRWSTSETSTLTINDTAISLSQGASSYSTVDELTTDEFSFSSSTQLALSSGKRLMIFTMELYSA